MKRIVKAGGYFFFLLFVVLLILELLYRFQIFEFYATEFNYLNRTEKPTNKKRVLIIGDSFSAAPNSYVDHLRNSNPNLQFLNFSVPGTGIKQHELYLLDKVVEFNPEVVIYQFYVGNDLIDINHPINFKKANFFKNCYWLLSDKLIVLQYLNFKLAGLKTNPQTFDDLRNPEFSVDYYNNRQKSLFKIDSTYLTNGILLKKDQLENYKIWQEKFSNIIKKLPENIKIKVLVLPHCSQVSKLYFQNIKKTGANLETEIQEVNYPLILQIKKDFPTVEFLNPLSYFQEQEKKGNALFYGNDPHLNNLGQKSLSEFMNKW